MRRRLTQLKELGLNVSASNKFVKRLFDIVVSFIGLLMTAPVIAVGWVAAAISTRNNGFFVQQRIGLNGKPFFVLKLRSMRVMPELQSSVTADGDRRITKTGRILRKLKIDELPQLWNVLVGQMSLVGPRPDVAGFADQLQGEDRVVLTIRPGITGPATIAFRNEEEILASVNNPEVYNREVIWPEKVAINRQYIQEQSLVGDIKLLWQTVVGTRMP